MGKDGEDQAGAMGEVMARQVVTILRRAGKAVETVVPDLERVICLGVTGLSRSGKTVLITSHQLPREETPSSVAETVEPGKRENGDSGEALRVPMPEGETPQSMSSPEDKPQPSGLEQALSVATSLPWSTWFLGYWQPRSCFCVESPCGTP
ncbi:hypothetical protein FLM9_140 [Candidatus Synechococcus spongiarum]|uniref:Uncharacterized protein n=1 Tax=Candidatus Synechococcus spongiarum TaxID=431041 RepID=A0A165B1M7_9SYNE|nr:hypothetical protein FLM9_140 [Candidatus Synechococcus spongiarum]